MRGDIRDTRRIDELLITLEHALGADARAGAIAEGRRLTNDQAIQLAIDTFG